MIKNASGQILIVLILIMTVGLAIGLAVIQRSISDVSTSTKTEQSQRAFSAAEAGIERQLGGSSTTGSLGNDSTIASSSKLTLPAANQAIINPGILKEEVANFWFADPNNNLATTFNEKSKLDVYWGDPVSLGAEQPALELAIIYKDSNQAYNRKIYFFDPQPTRQPNNGATTPDGCNGTYVTNADPNTKFLCKTTITDLPTQNNFVVTSYVLISARARILYSSSKHPIALSPTPDCPAYCSFPPQITVYNSTGTSGDTQRKIQLRQETKNIPFFFDYAVFSVADITK